MENSQIKFVKIAFVFIAFLSFLGGLLYFIYLVSSIDFYTLIIKFIIILLVALFLAFLTSMSIILYAYNKKAVGKSLAIMTLYCVKFARPFFILIAGMFKMNNDDFKRFFIDINNVIVDNFNFKFESKHILVVLPHCLQNFDCSIKITGNASKCKRCGKCSLGEIIDLCEKNSVKIAVVTGGTAARNIVKKHRPKLIVSVACERDLLSGIIDVGIIPVLGIINERPNGPCYNTCVNVNVFEEKFMKVIKVRNMEN